MVVYLVMSIALRRGQFKLDGIGTSAHLFGHLPCKFHLVSNLRDEADLFRDLRRIPRTSRSQDSSRKRPDLDACRIDARTRIQLSCHRSGHRRSLVL